MRYEPTDYEWVTIKPFLPNKPRGVPRVNDRRVLNGILWVLRSGAPWRDLLDNFESGPRSCPSGTDRGLSPPPNRLLARPGMTAISNYVLPKGSATNRVTSPIFTRIRTACLLCAFASRSALRTSPTLATGLPPTSRMTLPV